MADAYTPLPDVEIPVASYSPDSSIDVNQLDPAKVVNLDPDLAYKAFNSQAQKPITVSDVVTAAPSAAWGFAKGVVQAVPSILEGAYGVVRDAASVLPNRITGQEDSPEQAAKAAEATGALLSMRNGIRDQVDGLSRNSSRVAALLTNHAIGNFDKDLSKEDVVALLKDRASRQDMAAKVASGDIRGALEQVAKEGGGGLWGTPEELELAAKVTPDQQALLRHGYSGKTAENMGMVANPEMALPVGKVLPEALTAPVAGAALKGVGATMQAVGSVFDNPLMRRAFHYSPAYAAVAAATGHLKPAAGVLATYGLPAAGRGIKNVGQFVKDAGIEMGLTPEELAMVTDLRGISKTNPAALSKIGSSMLQQGAEGAVNMLPFALSAQSPEEFGQTLGTGAAFGVAGLGAREALRNTHFYLRGGNPIKLSDQYFEYGRPEDVLHAEATKDMHPDDVADINRTRHALQNVGGVFVLPEAEFTKRFGGQLGAWHNGDIYFKGERGWQWAQSHEPIHWLSKFLSETQRSEVNQTLLARNNPSEFASNYYNKVQRGILRPQIEAELRQKEPTLSDDELQTKVQEELGKLDPLNVDYEQLPDRVADKSDKLGMTKQAVLEEMLADSLKHFSFSDITQNPDIIRKLQLGAGKMSEALGIPLSLGEAKGILGVNPSYTAVAAIENIARKIAKDSAGQGVTYGTPITDPNLHFDSVKSALRGVGMSATDAQAKAQEAIDAASQVNRTVPLDVLVKRALSGKWPDDFMNPPKGTQPMPEPSDIQLDSAVTHQIEQGTPEEEAIKATADAVGKAKRFIATPEEKRGSIQAGSEPWEIRFNELLKKEDQGPLTPEEQKESDQLYSKAEKEYGSFDKWYGERVGRAPLFMPDLDQNLDNVIKDYVGKAGFKYTPHEAYRPLNEGYYKDLADTYAASGHNPDDPEVQKSYNVFKKAIIDQYKTLVEHGYKIEPWPNEGQPYANSAEMLKDLRGNKHLYYFETARGYGDEGDASMELRHPMLEGSGIHFGDKEAMVNDIFRAVHDALGHGAMGFQFGPRGEYNAFLKHASTLPHEAWGALANETIGPNSWTNFGPHMRDEQGNILKKGDPGYLSLPERPFVAQRANVLKFMPESGIGKTGPNAITANEVEGTNSRPVSQDEFYSLRDKGKAALQEMRADKKRSMEGFENPERWNDVLNQTFAKVQKEWGGATINPETGGDIKLAGREGGGPYAMSVKDPGQKTIEIPLDSPQSVFNAAMNKAKKAFPQLDARDHYLGVFRDDSKGTIDIDPVAILDTVDQVESIGAHTRSIGGAYDYSTGNGVYPPHIKTEQGGRIGTPGMWDSALVNPGGEEVKTAAAEATGADPKKRFYEQKPDIQKKLTDYFTERGAQFMPELTPLQVAEGVHIELMKRAEDFLDKTPFVKKFGKDEDGLFSLAHALVDSVKGKPIPSDLETIHGKLGMTPTEVEVLADGFRGTVNRDEIEQRVKIGSFPTYSSEPPVPDISKALRDTSKPVKPETDPADWWKNPETRLMPEGEDFDPNFVQKPPMPDEVLNRAMLQAYPNNPEKVSMIGMHRNIDQGTPVDVRIDIPTFNRTGLYAQTIHERGIGKVQGYDSIVNLDGPISFKANEAGAAKVKGGMAKYPMAVVQGDFNPSRRLPNDINDLQEWTPVGFDPKRHSYFYDKETDTPVTGGSQAVMIDNTAYVKDAEFGNKGDFKFMPMPDNPDAIKSAAIKTDDGRIFTGLYHGAIEARHSEQLLGSMNPIDGYVTNSGQFLNRDEALARGKQTGQIPKDFEPDIGDRGAHATDINTPEMAQYTGRQFMPDTEEGAAAYTRENKKLYPEALPITFKKNKDGTYKKDPNTGQFVPEARPWAFDQTPLYKEATKGIKDKEAADQAYADALGQRLADEYHKVWTKDPQAMAAKGWYRMLTKHVAEKMGPESATMFAQLLSATSPQNFASNNFRFALEAYNKYVSGDYDALIKNYNDAYQKYLAGDLTDADGNPITTKSKFNGYIYKNDWLPRKNNGMKFGKNSLDVLQVLAGHWWDNVVGKKVIQFVSNLSGTDYRPTIDLWAARTADRLSNEGMTKRWRDLPANEGGIAPRDFDLAQKAYLKAAELTGENPDDLQAIAWFGEKLHYGRMGWIPSGPGAELGDFRPFAAAMQPVEGGRTLAIPEGIKLPRVPVKPKVPNL